MSEQSRNKTVTWFTMGAAITAAAMLFNAGMRTQAIESRQSYCEAKTAAIEASVTEMRQAIKCIPVMQNDLEWIRKNMEKQNKLNGGSL